MLLKPAPLQQGTVGIAGHIGVGHTYSHSGFMNDDSVGFAILVVLLAKACSLDIVVNRVTVYDGKEVEISLVGGGVGRAVAARGFTPFEVDMMQRAIGQQCFAPQTFACQIFGRIYGQGVSEPAAAFCLAMAKAILDTIRKNWGETLSAPDNVPYCCGEFLGGTLYIDDLAVTWLLTINASVGGIGPNEDAEGIIPIGNKGKLMEKLGMDTIPIIVLESKAYVPAVSKDIKETTFWVRWNSEMDNTVVGECLARALEENAYPYNVCNTAYPRKDTALADESSRIGGIICQLGKDYASSLTSWKKVELASQLAKLASEDIGGSIFMSSSIHYYAGSGGLWPGQCAVLSLLVDKEYAQKMNTMVVEQIELEQAADITIAASVYLGQRSLEAIAILKRLRPSLSPDDLLALVQ